MSHRPKRMYWQDSIYEALDRMKLLELVGQAGFDETDMIFDLTRTELIDALIDTQVEAEAFATEAEEDYPLRRPVRTTLPDWLVSSLDHRVHLRWEDTATGHVEAVLDDHPKWAVPAGLGDGDLVVTVMGSDAPIVSAVEQVREEHDGTWSVTDQLLVAQPVLWYTLWRYAYDLRAPGPRSARLSLRKGRRLLEALTEEIANPTPQFVVAGDCASGAEALSPVTTLARLQAHERTRSEGVCEACETPMAWSGLEGHFDRPACRALLLEVQDHVDDAALVCGPCHALLHPHPVAALRRALRPACPSCGARDARSIRWGLRADGSVLDDDDIAWGGCVIDSRTPVQWRCNACHTAYLTTPTPGQGPARGRRVQRWRLAPTPSSSSQPGGRPHSDRRAHEVRLASADGAAFSLVPVPDVDDSGAATTTFDLELVTPDRLVRYLRRPVATDFITELAKTWWDTAAEQNPEQNIATFSDYRSGLTMAVLESTPLEVTLEITVVADQEAQMPEHDGVTFTVSRADLIAAYHAILALAPAAGV